MQHHLLNGCLQRFAHILGLDGDFLRLLGVHILAGNDHIALASILKGENGPDFDLNNLGGALAYLDAQQVAQMHGDSLVKAIAGQTQAGRSNDTAQRNDSHLGGAAADVHNHRSGGFGNRQVGSHSRRHRLFDEIGLAGTCLNSSLEHGPLLDGGCTARDADDNAGLGLPRVLSLRSLVDESRQHGFRYVVVGNDAVFQRVLGGKGIRGMVDHVLCLVAYRQNTVGALLDGNHGGLIDYDALTGDGYQRVGSAKVDGHVGRHLPGQAGKEVKKGHWAITFLLYWFTDFILVLTISA